MTTHELIEFLCDNIEGETARTLESWANASRRLADFLQEHRLKIRKKLRQAASSESLASVLLELEVARWLVEDRRCRVEYERFGQGQIRSPDLTVTFRERTVVHLEVTLVQAPALGCWDWKLITLISHKLGQIVPESSNLLVIGSSGAPPTLDEVARAMKLRKEKVEQKEADFLAKLGLRDTDLFH